jgi:mono/diheme cytochrome c family protein
MTQAYRGRAAQYLGVLTVLAGVFTGGCASTPQAATPAPATAAAATPASFPALANGGVFTSAQATRGGATFQQNCQRCHGLTEFSSVPFRRFWANKPLGDLFFRISTTMPRNAPGSLTPQQYADVVGYFLSLNEYPAGARELPPQQEVLDAIKFPAFQ